MLCLSGFELYCRWVPLIISNRSYKWIPTFQLIDELSQVKKTLLIFILVDQPDLVAQRKKKKLFLVECWPKLSWIKIFLFTLYTTMDVRRQVLILTAEKLIKKVKNFVAYVLDLRIKKRLHWRKNKVSHQVLEISFPTFRQFILLSKYILVALRNSCRLPPFVSKLSN